MRISLLTLALATAAAGQALAPRPALVQVVDAPVALERTISGDDRLHAQVRLHNQSGRIVTAVTLLYTIRTAPGTEPARVLRKVETVAVTLAPEATVDVELTGVPLAALATLCGETAPTVELALEGVTFERGAAWQSGAAPIPPIGDAPTGTAACLDDGWAVHAPGEVVVSGGVSRVCGVDGRLEGAR